MENEKQKQTQKSIEIRKRDFTQNTELKATSLQIERKKKEISNKLNWIDIILTSTSTCKYNGVFQFVTPFSYVSIHLFLLLCNLLRSSISLFLYATPITIHIHFVTRNSIFLVDMNVNGKMWTFIPIQSIILLDENGLFFNRSILCHSHQKKLIMHYKVYFFRDVLHVPTQYIHFLFSAIFLFQFSIKIAFSIDKTALPSFNYLLNWIS